MASALFKECVTALNAETLSTTKESHLKKIFRKEYPITDWGKIDWSKIKNHIELSDSKKIIPALASLLGSLGDKTVYIEWSDGDVSIIKTTIDNVIASLDDVLCVSSHVFIFNPNLKYIIEIQRNGKITVGLL